MSVNSSSMREVMRFWATGVAIVTVNDGDTAHGMTVNSFTSLSLEPPLVLVALNRRARTHDHVQQSGVFGVTLLAADQQEVSNRFANPQTEASWRFADVETHTLATGAPLLAGGLAYFDCRVVAAHEVGTHTMFVGAVVAAEQGKAGAPLLYFNQSYRELEA